MTLFNRKPSAPERRDITTVPWRGNTTSFSGESVNTYSALTLPTVWRCVSLVSELLSNTPVDLYRQVGETKTLLTNQPNIIKSPSLRLTRREWVYEYVSSMMLRGNAYGVVVAETPDGRPDVVEWVSPDCVSVRSDYQLNLPEYYVDGKPVPRERMIHIRNFLLPGSVVGLSPIEIHAESIGIGLATRKFGAQWFGEGAHPSAILSTSMRLDKDQAEEIKQNFVATLRKRREPAVLTGDLKYQSIQTNPNESQFLETMRYNVEDIARIFGIPIEMLGAAPLGKSETYANREQKWQDFVSTSLMHYAIRLEEAWNKATPNGQYVKFNMDALLRADTMTRYQAHQIGIGSGFITVNEARDMEDLPPLSDAEIIALKPAAPVTAAPVAARSETPDLRVVVEGSTINVPPSEIRVDVQPADVHVAAPKVHVEAPHVHVQAPDVRVAAPDVTVNVEPHLTAQLSSAPREKLVERDAQGQVVRTVDRDVNERR